MQNYKTCRKNRKLLGPRVFSDLIAKAESVKEDIDKLDFFKIKKTFAL